MKMQETGKSLTDSDISEFENEFQIKLPQDYIDFMLKNNGGVPEEDWIFDYIENGNANSSVIRDFFVIYKTETGEYDDLKVAYKNGVAPPDYMPIATDPGGNVIFMAVKGENRGKIYFGNHELEDEKTGYMLISLISDTFSEFIEKCYVDISED